MATEPEASRLRECADTNSCAVLDLHGWQLTAPAQIDAGFGLFRLRGFRPVMYGGPTAAITVREIWRAGRDEQRIVSTVEGHHLERASWHAQIEGDGAICSERVDIDRTKAPWLMRHRHPYGEPNNVREVTTISTPEAYLNQVETDIGLLYLQDEQD